MRIVTNDTSLEARTYSAHEVLRDGGSIYVRAIRADDKERLLDHFRHLSQDSIYYRFFGLKLHDSGGARDAPHMVEQDRSDTAPLMLVEDGERDLGASRPGDDIATDADEALVAANAQRRHQGDVAYEVDLG